MTRVAISLSLLLLLAGWLAPREVQGVVRGLRVGWVVAAVVILAVTATRAMRRYRAEAGTRSGSGPDDVVAALRKSLRDSLPFPAVADAVAHELAVLYYAMVPWARRADGGAGSMAFSYHRESGLQALLVAAVAISVIETLAVHLLMRKAYPVAATALLILSVYGIVWLVGFLRALRLRPVLLTERDLHIRLGLLWDVQVPYGEIEGILSGRGVAAERSPDILRAAIGTPRVVIGLRRAFSVSKPYGLGKREVRRIGFSVDERKRFQEVLLSRIRSS